MAIVNYEDEFDLPPVDYDINKVPKSIKDRAEGVRDAIFGKQNKEFLAQSVEISGLLSAEAKSSAAEISVKQNSLEQRFLTLQQETTNGDYDSAPEIIDARGGKATLGQRLDETTAQLAQTEGQLNSRMDTIISLPEGSTTNDARLEDIKVGFDGTIYSSPGESVRKQVGKTADKITDLQKGYFFDNSDLTQEGYVETNGADATHASFMRSDFKDLKGQKEIIIKKPFTNLGSTIAYYNDSKVFIKGYSVPSPSAIDIKYPVPFNAKYVRFSHRNDQPFFAYSNLESVVDGKIERTKIEMNRNSYKRIIDITSRLVLPDKTEKIKLIGDSITAGLGGTGYATDGEFIYGSYRTNTTGTCWANMLRTYLNSDFVAVKNFGVSGRKSGDLVQNLTSLIRADDTIIICMIGTNDRVGVDPITGTDTTMQSLYDNLCVIKNYCDNNEKEIIFMSGIPTANSGEVNVHFRMEDVDKVYMKMAQKYNIEYISMYQEFKQYCQLTGKSISTLLGDGLHPNDYGYEVMYDIISRKLGLPAKITVAMA